MKIDMHMHSTFSDGTFTVPQIVEFARKILVIFFELCGNIKPVKIILL